MAEKNVAGCVTSTGDAICVSCSKLDTFPDFRVGAMDAPIHHPAPDGIYAPDAWSHMYGAPCAICGWAIQRSREATSHD